MIFNAPPTNGRLSGMSREKYDRDTERERSTRLKMMVSEPQGPRAYYLKHVVPQPEKPRDKWDDYQPKVDHFVMGHLFHSLVLDGEVNWIASHHKRGSEGWKKLCRKHRPEKWIISPSQEVELLAWERALDANEEAKALCRVDGFSEQVIVWDEEVEVMDDHYRTTTVTVPMKCAVDRLPFTGGVIPCIKTTRARSEEEFIREVEKLHYDFSAGFYRRGYHSLPQFAGTHLDFKWVAIFKGDPCWCYVIDAGQYLDKGDQRVLKAVQRLARCRLNESQLADGEDRSKAWPDDLMSKGTLIAAPTLRYSTNYGEEAGKY